MVDAHLLRTWAVRVAAPLAFFTAVTVLVVIVQSALADEEPTATPTAPLSNVAGTQTTKTATEPGTKPKKKFYRVKSGDTLGSIAERVGTDVARLVELNPSVDPLTLAPGKRIRLR
jgi:LysM repeat protein